MENSKLLGQQVCPRIKPGTSPHPQKIIGGFCVSLKVSPSLVGHRINLIRSVTYGKTVCVGLNNYKSFLLLEKYYIVARIVQICCILFFSYFLQKIYLKFFFVIYLFLIWQFYILLLVLLLPFPFTILLFENMNLFFFPYFIAWKFLIFS